MHISTPKNITEPIEVLLGQFHPVLRIRTYYYADRDPGSKKYPYGSGS